MGQDTLGHEAESGRAIDRPETERLGETLRREREKRGLTHDQVFEMTRLRPKFLDALEKEDWSRIPDPAFIRGFVVTYGKALGLRETLVLDLYARAGVPGSSPPRLPVAPTRQWKTPSFFVMIFLSCAAVVLYLVTDYPSSDGPRRTPVPLASEPSRPMAREAIPSPQQETKAPDQPTPAVERVDRGQASVAPPVPAKREDPQPQVAPQEPAEVPAPGDLPPREDPQTRDEEARPFKVLRADVKEETWVRIAVDDEEAREYIFRPGSRPEWKARHGFDLLIGNAGGVDLEFEGKRIGPLGASGKVLRLKLPGDFVGRSPQE